MKNEEIKYLDYQILGLGFMVAVTIISIIITYNQEQKLKGNDTIISDKAQISLVTLNRVLVLILAFLFLYINYKQFEIAKKKGEEIKPFELQILVSLLVIISALLSFYILIAYRNGEVDIENPEI
jgi:cytochrome bd-type quinol oxidase subunit 2